jgi:hypothetical protein
MARSRSNWTERLPLRFEWLAAADTSQQFGSPRNEAQEKAGKQSSVDAAEFRRKENRCEFALPWARLRGT